MATSRKLGITSSMSRIHMPTRSIQPPKNAIAVPYSAAMVMVATEVMMPMSMDLPRPCEIRANRSSPPGSVPSQCSALGGSEIDMKSGSSYDHLQILPPNKANSSSRMKMTTPATADF